MRLRKPYPYTAVDAHVPHRLVTEEQAEAIAAKWTACQRQQSIEQNGFDVRDQEQVRAKKREWFVTTTNQARRVAAVVAVEIIPSPRQPCAHPCVGMWSIRDHPLFPPADCPHESCLCGYEVLFQDEIRGRFIAGWREHDNEE